MAVRFAADGRDYTRTLSLGAVTQFSAACWAKISVDTNGNSTIWSLDTDNSDYWILQTDFDGTGLTLWNDGTTTIPVLQQLTVDTWYFIGVSVNGATATVNVRAANSSTFSTYTPSLGANATTVLTNLRIGESVFGLEWLNGCVAGFKLWTGAILTQAEMEQESWTYLPNRTANLRSWHPFLQAETVDWSGNGNTLSGGTGTTTEDGPAIPWRRGRRRIRIRVGQNASAAPSPVIAPWSVPTPAASAGASAAPGPVMAPWSVPTPDVTTAGSPPTIAAPDLIVAPWSVPTPAVRLGITVHPSPVIAAWSVPAPSTTVPVNPGDDLDGPGQLSLNGFKMGGGTAYGLDELVGVDFDMPPVDNGNVNNPSSDGAQSGRKLAQPRIITASFKARATRDQMREVMENFRDNTPLADSDEEFDLAVQVLDRIYVTRGAVTRRSAPINKQYRLGLAKVVLQIECSDPRLYSRDLTSATIPDGGTVEVTNIGNRKTRPLVRIPGPSNTPSLEVFRTLADGSEDLRIITFNTVIASGEQVTVDVARGTAELGDGTSLTRYLTGSVALPSWVLGRGVSEISYSTAGGGAPPAVALWRHAWL